MAVKERTQVGIGGARPGRLADTDDDLAAARTTLRRMIREENLTAP